MVHGVLRLCSLTAVLDIERGLMRGGDDVCAGEEVVVGESVKKERSRDSSIERALHTGK